MRIAVVNGPNLNLLGRREPHIYGKQTFTDYFKYLKDKYSQCQLDYFQSNIEGELIDYLHTIGFSYQGIVLNAGAYTHTSIALADAIKAIDTSVVEVHISNVHKREIFRHHSYISALARGVIVGFGFKGYQLAIESFLS